MAVRGMKKRIGDMLIEENLITQEQLERALEIARESGKKIGETLVENGYTSDEAIMRALSNQLGIEIVSLAGVHISDEMIRLANASVLRKNRMVPLEYFQGNMISSKLPWRIPWIWQRSMTLRSSRICRWSRCWHCPVRSW